MSLIVETVPNEREDVFKISRLVEVLDVNGNPVMIPQEIGNHSLERLQQRHSELTKDLSDTTELLEAVLAFKAEQ